MTEPEIQVVLDAIAQLKLSVKQYLQRKLKEENFEITFEMLQVLALLWRRQNRNQQDIANTLQKNKASITPLLDNLCKRQLVVRTEDPSDRRNKIISLTPRGMQFKQCFMPVIGEFYDLLSNGISVRELDLITGVLTKMNKNIS